MKCVVVLVILKMFARTSEFKYVMGFKSTPLYLNFICCQNIDSFIICDLFGIFLQDSK